MANSEAIIEYVIQQFALEVQADRMRLLDRTGGSGASNAVLN